MQHVQAGKSGADDQGVEVRVGVTRHEQLLAAPRRTSAELLKSIL
jgi:hypothetical protein